MRDRMTIGEFARLTGLTAKALRHYDALGLLVPSAVDPHNGYRLYAAEQAGRGRTIRRLRELGLPLEDVRALLDDPDQAPKRLAAYRRDVEAELFRRQRVLHRLHRMIEGEWPMTIPEASQTPGVLGPDEERQVAVDLFNHVWELLETPERTAQQDERMVHAAHASRFHWENVGDAVNLAIGEWQCSRVYAVLGRAEPAMHHARRTLEIALEADLDAFYVAEGYEALARAHAVAGDRSAAEEARGQASEAASAIIDAEEREIFERDLGSLPL